MKRATVHYTVALLLIASVSTASFATVRTLIAAQKGNAPAINVAGRQRMLSQRIAGLTTELQHHPQPDTQALLDTAIDEMAVAHAALIEGSRARGIPPLPSQGPLRDVYLGPSGSDPLVYDFLTRAREALGGDERAADKVRQHARGDLLDVLDKTVHAHEAHAFAQIMRLERFEAALWILTLLLLAFEAGFIFRPLLRHLQGRVDDLEASRRKLLERENRLTLLLDATGDALVPLDLEGRVLEGASRRATEWFGAMPPGADGLVLLSDHDPDVQQRLEVSFTQLDDLETSLPMLDPIVVSRADETYRITPRVMLRGSERFGTLVVARRITAQIERERERARQRELERSLAAAAQANQAKSTFLATMSHELRTPLNAIIGYTEILEEELEDDRHLQDTSRILGAARHLLALIDQVLDLSRVEAGRLEVDLRPVDLRDILDEVDGLGRTLCEERTNTWRCSVPTLAMPVLTDTLRVKQILLNLVGNSAKFTQNGTVLLETIVRDDHAWIEVRDDGIGMTPDEMQRVWTAYTQADPSTSRRYGGTGLGLSLTRKLCDLLGFAITMDSEPERGTSVFVGVPLRPHQGTQASTPSRSGAGQVDQPSGGQP